ncbi:NAD-dependent epimerase/dehydratase family protein [Amycolatopsis sp.]|jgi:NAD(P)-dependent dehydrogenase (short-subunit alcohol dehydrogenase family)|uniref:NAD-dependent epimerase/dehydratase family protein n=1 Tax=Amycolatopsis sp. TaxID=37632 RepID=UPI002E08F55C|nr:NAD-dependent epimerase/dehydratase family protein [Amycolatopsis sp.]
MIVCVTGGTGFVGAHSAAEIVRRGHRVRLLARDRARVARALDPLGVDPAAVDVVVGDVTDPGVVAEAVRSSRRRRARSGRGRRSGGHAKPTWRARPRPTRSPGGTRTKARRC